MTNPLTAPWDRPFGLPPFDLIDDSHFAPAFEQGLTEARAAYHAISQNPEAPDFENTIAAMEKAGELLDRVLGVFFNVSSTDGNDARRALQREFSPRLAAFSSEIMMDANLFARVDTLWQSRDTLPLTDEQQRVLLLTRRRFVRAGAMLEGADRTRLAEIMQRLALLGTTFSQNVQKDEETWVMPLADDQLDGLPEAVISAARGAAAERGMDGQVITLSRSLIVPFLQFSTRRDLREKAYAAWTSRGEMTEETATAPIAAEILALRQERAKLLGYPDFAHFKLETEMAGDPQTVRDLLMAVWKPAKAQADRDAAILAERMHADGVNDTLKPWDWRHYATQRQRDEHQIDESEVKPYLELDNMIDAAFDVAHRLFGLSFQPIDAPLYHPDARAWEVRRGDTHVGVFIGDYFNRGPKRSGAWCSRFRDQHKLGENVSAIVVNVCNFAKPGAGEPALLTFDDARTLFHEFGHGLHGLLSNVTYPSISGTSVARDFVELPSQLYEHWLATPEVLSTFARHAETGAPMPKDLQDRLLAAENFDQGFATVEYVASALVDLDLHSGPPPADPLAAQASTLDGLGMPPAIRMRHATPHFLHVFSGDGYSSGYYSYMWSEVMDADAFAAFTETGDVFDPETAAALEQYIYSAGGRAEADALYTAFRGQMPQVEALLRQRGLAA